jgi:hypothetical protein
MRAASRSTTANSGFPPRGMVAVTFSDFASSTVTERPRPLKA